MLIREATIQDLSVILDIMNDAILNSTSLYDYSPRDGTYITDWFQKKQADKHPVLVCDVDGYSVGFGTYGSFRIRDGYRFTVEHSIYFQANYQGKGMGKILLQALIDRARTEGYHTMVAGIDAANQGSILFHQKMGFAQVGTFREVGYKFDRWLDLVFMQLVL